MKYHGLWRFHRAQRELRERSDHAALWWVDIEGAHRQYTFSRMGWGRVGELRNADAIIQCAVRYARRFGVSIRTVAEWNALCLRIAERAGFTHRATLNACTFDGRVRAKSVVRVVNGTPRVLAEKRQLIDRLERMMAFRALRLETESSRRERLKLCAVCGSANVSKHLHYMGRRSKNDDLLEQIREHYGSAFFLCFVHRMALGKLEVRALHIASVKSALLKSRRKLNESTKNITRVDGSPVLHHGGGNQWGREGIGSQDCTERGNANH